MAPQAEPHFECPVYRTWSRTGEQLTSGAHTNFVLHIRLRALTPSFWVERGAAILLEV